MLVETYFCCFVLKFFFVFLFFFIFFVFFDFDVFVVFFVFFVFVFFLFFFVFLFLCFFFFFISRPGLSFVCVFVLFLCCGKGKCMEKTWSIQQFSHSQAVF